MKSYKTETKSVYDTEAVALLVQAASRFQSKITLEYESKTANAKSIMGLLSLGLLSGHEVLIQAEGEDEDIAAGDIKAFLSNTGN